MNEIWKLIKKYPNYEISNFGNVRSISRYCYRRGNKIFVKGQILKQSISKNGYKKVTLYDGKRSNSKQCLVHRLVAEEFVDNRNKYKYVNHIDENKANNMADNLEWCTAKYNSNYGTSIQRRVAHQNWESITDKQSKKVIQKDLRGNEIARYKSTMEAQRNGYNSSGVCKCCNGYLKTYRGYIWEYT